MACSCAPRAERARRCGDFFASRPACPSRHARTHSRVGSPASVGPDAPLGCSCVGFQSSDVALELRDEPKNILIRLVGTSSRVPESARDNPTQSGKPGFCVCCTLATRFAVPVIREVGAHDWLKRRGMRLLKSFGPWAPRSLAAGYYLGQNGRFPQNWEYAAKALDIPLPGPLADPFREDTPLRVLSSTRPS